MTGPEDPLQRTFKYPPPEEQQEPEDSEKPVDVIDEEPLTFEKGKEVLVETGDRLKEAGWKPFRDMVGSYVGRVVEAAKGLADGFEGQKKRGD